MRRIKNEIDKCGIFCFISSPMFDCMSERQRERATREKALDWANHRYSKLKSTVTIMRYRCQTLLACTVSVCRPNIRSSTYHTQYRNTYANVNKAQTHLILVTRYRTARTCTATEPIYSDAHIHTVYYFKSKARTTKNTTASITAIIKWKKKTCEKSRNLSQ